MAVDLALGGGLRCGKPPRYDIVAIDRDLPVVYGDRVCAQLITLLAPPRILMLTAAGDLGDRVAGLDLDADDYLGKAG